MARPVTPWSLEAVLYGLTAATAIVDAACYLGIGHVLVANMTGNIVFLGFAIAGASGFSVTAFLVAIASFFVGAVLGGRLGSLLDKRRRRWLTTTSAIQSTLALVAAITVAAGLLGATGAARFGVIALLGVGTGVQNATIRRLAIPDLTTTVLTLTFTGLAADSSLAGGNHPRRGRRVASITSMLAGAILGGAVMVHVGFATTLWVLAGVLCLVTIGFALVTEEPATEPVTVPTGT